MTPISAPRALNADWIVHGSLRGRRRRETSGAPMKMRSSHAAIARLCSPARSRASTAEMRIGIDARELCGKPTGVGRHLAGLLGAWSVDTAASRHTFVLYAHQDVSTPLHNTEMRVIR